MCEKEIIKLIQNRDETGLKELLRHYGPLMRYIIAPILSNAQDQEDCLSEVSMRVWDKIELFDQQRGSWNAWLTALTRNAALNRTRSKSFIDGVEEIPTNTPSPEPTPEETVIQQEYKAVIAQALQQLSPQERMLFYRKYYYLQSTAQIASELIMTERAVEGKLYRLRKRLRNILEGEEYE